MTITNKSRTANTVLSTTRGQKINHLFYTDDLRYYIVIKFGGDIKGKFENCVQTAAFKSGRLVQLTSLFPKAFFPSN